MGVQWGHDGYMIQINNIHMCHGQVTWDYNGIVI